MIGDADEGRKTFQPGRQRLQRLLLPDQAALLELQRRQQGQRRVRRLSGHDAGRRGFRIRQQYAMDTLLLFDDGHRLTGTTKGFERQARQPDAKPESPDARWRKRPGCRLEERQRLLSGSRGNVPHRDG